MTLPLSSIHVSYHQRAVAPAILSPLGPLSLRHLTPTLLGGVSFIFNRAIPKTTYPSTGGSGRGACPPVPPPPPPSPRSPGLGGGPINQGPLSFSHGGEGPSDPPPPRLGLAVSNLALPLTNPLPSSASSTRLNHILTSYTGQFSSRSKSLALPSSPPSSSRPPSGGNPS